MMRASQFGGGNEGQSVINDTGNAIAYSGDDTVKWLLIVADINNGGVVFLHLHPTEPAEWEKGIPLYPGGYVLLSEYDGLYNGVIHGISGAGTTAKLFWHDGR